MRHVLALVLALLVFVVGCVTEDANKGNNAPVVVPMSIVGNWSVTRLEGAAGIVVSPPSGRGATVDFAPTVGALGGRIDIYTGVNRGSGRYNFSPGERDVGAISVERIQLTMMASTPDAMAYESALLAALGSARTVTRIENGLVIECGDARIHLVHRA